MQGVFESWIQTDFAQALTSQEPTVEMIGESEDLVETIPQVKASSAFRHALALAELGRAKQLLKGGVSTALALFHIQRAMQLESKDINSAEIAEIDKNARTLLSTTKYPQFGLSIDINPAIPLDIQSIIYASFSSSFLSRSKEDRQWRLVSSTADDVALSVEIENAAIDIPDLSGLPLVNSQYLSHYEDVPNPWKDSLHFQLTMAKSDVDYAESSYESAVRSYNYDPTEWSLNSANSAYTRYKQAINNYNSLVDTYNLTPSTVEQPVYLPYSFRQGNVQFGCTMTVKVAIGGKAYSFSSRSMDAALVRFGTKLTDSNESTRRDFPLSFDMSFERLLAHLRDAEDAICAKISPLLAALTYPTYVALSSDETALLQNIMSPWGPDRTLLQQLNVPTWEKDAISAVSVGQLQLTLPEVALRPGKNRSALQAQTAVRAFEPLVCIVESIQNGQVVSSGSAALIGPDGLLLTCAHVLNSPTISVVFPSGPNKGTYAADIVSQTRRRTLP